jgi:hypothetical protein
MEDLRDNDNTMFGQLSALYYAHLAGTYLHTGAKLCERAFDLCLLDVEIPVKSDEHHIE